jgi:hypothetical protein
MNSNLSPSDSAAVTPQPDSTTSPAPQTPYDAKYWSECISAAERNRDEYFKVWKESVAYRVQKPFGGTGDNESTQDRVAVPEDWSRTKQKQAQLMFKLPKIVARATDPAFEVSEDLVTAAVNQKLTNEMRAYYAMDEALADVINAAGIMAVMVGIDIRTETVTLPPEAAAPGSLAAVPAAPAAPPDGGMPAPVASPDTPEPNVGGGAPPSDAQPSAPPFEGAAPPLAGPQPRSITRIVSKRLYADRVSPAQLLWPAEFVLSDWDKSPWVGYDTFMPATLAKKTFKVLVEEGWDGAPTQKPKLLSEDILTPPSKGVFEEYARVRTIFYRTANYDPTVTHPDAIRKIVFVDGCTPPVIHEDLDWQKYVPPTLDKPAVPPTTDPTTGQTTDPGMPAAPAQPGKYIGVRNFPLRIGTLTYISDVAIPPSDSEAGRSQVREMIRSRSQMLRQRDTSIPIRWYDVNRLDETIADKMRAGEWNDMIPVNGPGERIIGEVARANYPRENFQFQGVISNDLDRSWALSNNQINAPNDTTRSATEVNVMASAGGIRADYEKDRVNKFVMGIAEVTFGLMQMFIDGQEYASLVGPQGQNVLTPFTRADLTGDYTFEFVPDSSDRIDTATKQGNVLKMFNLLGNSPTTNRPNLEREIWQLHGFDPAKLTQAPPPPNPDKPNISYRFSGDDLLNPMAVALLTKSGIQIGPDDIKAAATMIADAVQKLQEAKLTIAAGYTGGPIVSGPGLGGPAVPGAPPHAVPPQNVPVPDPAHGAVQPPAEHGVNPILKRTDNGDRLV